MENNVDEANSVNNSSCLHENDIPGASLSSENQKVHWKFWSLITDWYVGTLQQKEENRACFEVSTQEINIDTMKTRSTSADLL